MCAVCVEFQKGKLTPQEARRALTELIQSTQDMDLEHVVDVLETLDQIELTSDQN